MNKPASIKVAIADDHSLLRQGIVSLVGNMKGIEVAGQMSSGEEAVNFARDKRPDVFLMDIMMRGMNGIEATRWIKEQTPEIKVILISGEVNKDLITAGIKSGIDGYLNKDIDEETLFLAILTVQRGERYFSPEITALVFKDFYMKEKDGKGLPPQKKTTLSRREEEVLTLIATGKTLKEIAETLFISVKTVETHKLHTQDKLGLTNTAQLVMFAIENNLVQINQNSAKH